MATIQRINIIGSREGSRNRRRLKANQTGKKFRVGIKSNISTNRNNLISGRSEERFSRNAETDLVCRLLLEKKNLGRIAGAGVIDHVHEHVVPRWAGDTNFMPALAEVKVLPEHLAETRERLAAAWPR